MRLLKVSGDGNITLHLEEEQAVPKYTVLSHCWGSGAEDVVIIPAGLGIAVAEMSRSISSRAKTHCLWIDAICIDQADGKKGKAGRARPTELSEAMKSMFHWYETASVCYRYLEEVGSQTTLDIEFRHSRWFTRGWTLQELVAPKLYKDINPQTLHIESNEYRSSTNCKTSMGGKYIALRKHHLRSLCKKNQCHDLRSDHPLPSWTPLLSGWRIDSDMFGSSKLPDTMIDCSKDKQNCLEVTENSTSRDRYTKNLQSSVADNWFRRSEGFKYRDESAKSIPAFFRGLPGIPGLGKIMCVQFCYRFSRGQDSNGHLREWGHDDYRDITWTTGDPASNIASLIDAQDQKYVLGEQRDF